MASNRTARINREAKTISTMLSLYCNNHHRKNGRGLCDDCRKIQEYALTRLQNCPFIENKPTCATCLVHCYNKEMRNKVRQIMRYSGPRLLLFHPILAIRHFLDRRIKPLSLKEKNDSTPCKVKDKTDGKTS